MTSWKQLEERLTATMKIDPNDYALTTSSNRWDSFLYALAGWAYMLRRQKNTRIMSVASPLVVLFAIWLRVSLNGLALIILAMTIVWLTEFLNAAVEAAIDLSTAEYHPLAKVAKDVAAAAVLLGVVSSVLVGLLVIGPPLWERLQSWFPFLPTLFVEVE